MKIAIDIRDAVKEKTGKGYYALNLVRELLKLDKQNTYFLFTDRHTQLFREHENVVMKTIIPLFGPLWHNSVLKKLYKEKIDIYFAPTSYIIPALHNPKKLKVIMTVHDLVSFLFPSKHNKKAVFIEKLCLLKALKKVAKVISVSNNTKKDLINHFRCNEDLISVAHIAGSDFFKPTLSKNIDILNDFRKVNSIMDPFILGVGTLEPRKNFPALVRAFAKISNDFPKHILVIAGGKGWHSNEIFRTVRKLGLDKKVRFLGYVLEKSLKKLYNLADVFVYPSLYEGFGLPPLEAMQSGCPVITSNVSSLPEVVGDAAITVNPQDDDEIAEAITRVLRDADLHENLRKKGLIRTQDFTWEKTAKKVLEVFNNL
jgi:glycosyltransferase involved in cell wall biosynthesis